MIRLDSRYARGEIVYVRDHTGTVIPTVFRTVIPPFNVSSVYKWKDGDRADMLGKRVEDKAHLWWAVFDRNREYIDPLTVPAGAGVIIR